jgi:serine/threonine protein kinase
MRCLNCRENGLPRGTEKCPHCGALMAFLLRDMLPSGTTLHHQRYCIDYPLGRGGFGITYRAFDTTFDMVVVIKEFFPQEQAMRKAGSGRVAVPTTQHGHYEKALNYFLEEARILAKIKKENVVRVFDYFKHHNTAYIVMEMVEGHTLRELLDQQPGRYFPAGQVEAIVDQMVSALAAIHRHGVFHLDISPDNVLQTDDGKIVLIDFGAARQSLRTNESYSGGPHQYKLAYAAPEILAASGVDARSDLFELAMMTYELLTGNLPPSVFQRSATGDSWQPQLPDERWQKALARALHLKQELRPASVLDWWNLYRRPGIVFGERTKGKGIVIGQRAATRRGLTRSDKKR